MSYVNWTCEFDYQSQSNLINAMCLILFGWKTKWYKKISKHLVSNELERFLSYTCVYVRQVWKHKLLSVESKYSKSINSKLILAEPNNGSGLKTEAWFRRRTFHEPNLIRKESLKNENAHFGQTAYKIRYNNLCIRFGTWKVRRLNQSCSKVAPKAKIRAGLGEDNGWAVPNWNRQS